MKVQQVLNCSFSNWYEKCKKITIKSIAIPLEQDFVDYLLTDGVVLPADSLEPAQGEPSVADDDSEKYDGEEVNWEDESEDGNPVAQIPSFPLLDAEIRAAVTKLGGSVFPKLNWSSAKDATWISLNNSMKCVTPGDVYLLLKSSEFVGHDLSQPFKHCVDSFSTPLVKYELVLRQWVNINPSTEFRCFVKNGTIIGVSQRDFSNYYEHIASQETEIIQDIMSFFHEKVNGKLADDNYVFDIYRQSKDNVILVDFNPFGATTDALLFEWDDLLTNSLQIENNQKPVFKFVTNGLGVQPNPYRCYALPQDFVHLSTGEDPYKLIDFLKLVC